jgi:hypothetical protein
MLKSIKKLKQDLSGDSILTYLFTVHDKHEAYSLACNNWYDLVEFLFKLFQERLAYGYYPNEKPIAPVPPFSDEEYKNLPPGFIKTADFKRKIYLADVECYENSLEEYNLVESIQSGKDREAVVEFMLVTRSEHGYERIIWEELRWM